MKKVLAAAVLFLVLLLLFPSVCVEGAKSGLLLWFNTIIPTLFPFILVTNIIRDFNGIPFLERIFAPLFSRLFKTGTGGSYAVVLGFLCGYPMGAKAVCDSLSCQRISRSQAAYLLSFVNNPSPVYMISYVALFTLESKSVMIPVIVIAFLSSVITAFIYRHSVFSITKPLEAMSLPSGPAVSDRNFFDSCMMSAFELLVKVGGYMILFSTLSFCICSIPGIPPLAACMISGLLEQTTGLGLLKAQSFSLQLKTALAMGLICFGGLCITAQTYSVIHSQGLSIKPYIIFKFISGLTAALLTAGWFMAAS